MNRKAGKRFTVIYNQGTKLVGTSSLDNRPKFVYGTCYSLPSLRLSARLRRMHNLQGFQLDERIDYRLSISDIRIGKLFISYH